ncbi:hypothetical protein GCM10010123_46190 [Pilimelia anulata]|uniref:Uncharacterized protein n=1 Tax=Pilimelia anulata TaxID=53371 RepID=A0A8J3FF11_9ACTN|nr:hypothetical protein [Pilimelia anulata]GGK10983.1 hypothetical protein GCM10010123_46190 [Pilimelia anulata]
MSWPPATALAVNVRAGLVAVTADPGGAEAVTPQGHLRLLAGVRRRCGIANGCRVLAVAAVDNRRLIIHPSIHPPTHPLRWTRCSQTATPRFSTGLRHERWRCRGAGGDPGGVAAVDQARCQSKDLLAPAAAARPAVPTFSEFVPEVAKVTSQEPVKAYGTYWNRSSSNGVAVS